MRWLLGPLCSSKPVLVSVTVMHPGPLGSVLGGACCLEGVGSASLPPRLQSRPCASTTILMGSLHLVGGGGGFRLPRSPAGWAQEARAGREEASGLGVLWLPFRLESRGSEK